MPAVTLKIHPPWNIWIQRRVLVAHRIDQNVEFSNEVNPNGLFNAALMGLPGVDDDLIAANCYRTGSAGISNRDRLSWQVTEFQLLPA